MRKYTPKGEAVRWLREQTISETDDCILWPFPSKNRGGYGQAYIAGKTYPAHRLVAIWAHGEPPTPKHQAAHGCNNPLCVNPRHVRWATPLENHADKIASGTTSRGAKNPKTRLTEAQARSIKYQRTSEAMTDLAAEFGVDRCTILDIRKGRTWAWL